MRNKNKTVEQEKNGNSQKSMKSVRLMDNVKKDANFSPQCPYYTLRYINVNSLFNRLSSKVSAFNRNKRSLYDKFLNPPIYFVYISENAVLHLIRSICMLSLMLCLEA